MNKTHRPHAHCVTLFARLSDYLNNELDAETRQFINDHLRECRPCQVCLSTLRRTVELCRHFKVAPLPTELSSRLRALFQKSH